MSETRVSKHTFVYNGERYFRDKSEDVLMCSYGEKEDPLGTKASLNVTNHVDREPAEGQGPLRHHRGHRLEPQSQVDVETEGRLKYFTARGRAPRRSRTRRRRARG